MMNVAPRATLPLLLLASLCQNGFALVVVSTKALPLPIVPTLTQDFGAIVPGDPPKRGDAPPTADIKARYKQLDEAIAKYEDVPRDETYIGGFKMMDRLRAMSQRAQESSKPYWKSPHWYRPGNNHQEETLLNEINGFNIFLLDAFTRYDSVAELFDKSKKTIKGGHYGENLVDGEMDIHWMLENLIFSVPALGGQFIDQVPNISHGVSFNELQDYFHFVLEMVGLLKLGGPDYDREKLRDWACLNMKKSERVSPPTCKLVAREK